MFFELFIHQSILKKVLQVPQKNIKQHKCAPTLIINQHITMTSEGSRDTEDWSYDAENAALHHVN